MELSVIAAALALDEGCADPRIQHHQLDLQVIGNIRSPGVANSLVLFDLSSEVKLFSDIEQSFLVVDSLAVVTHALDSDDSLLSEHPTQEISHCVLVSEVAQGKDLIAEEVKRSDEESASIVKALHACSESDGSSCTYSASSVVILGESRGFSSDEIVKLIVLIIDKVQSDSAVKQRLFALIFGEERRNGLVIEGGDES